MELKQRQLQVQKDGTITGFNYNYCKILYDEAQKIIKTDFIDKNGDVFPLIKDSAEIFRNRHENYKKSSQEKDDIERKKIIDEEKIKEILERREKDRCAIHIALKKNSILENIIKHIEKQLDIKAEKLVLYNTIYNIEKLESDIINPIFLFLEKVKKYLAMFEFENEA
jgi:hypothetical protein